MLLAANGSRRNLLIIVLSEHPEASTTRIPEKENCIKHILARMDMRIWNATTQTIAVRIIPIRTTTKLLGRETASTGEIPSIIPRVLPLISRVCLEEERHII